MIYLGYDPGGANNSNGVAILDVSGTEPVYQVGSVNTVDEAIDWFGCRGGGKIPVAAGIDALLYWETGRCGWRAADFSLREVYPSVRNSVLSQNSAYGSMAVQGMACAMRLRERWPDVLLTETHPKVLYFALHGSSYSWPSTMVPWLHEKLGCIDGASVATDHQWDALISAWAAMKGHTRAWLADLRALSTDALEPAGKVAYWWPEDLRSSGLITMSAKQASSGREASNTSSRGKTTSVGYANKHDQEVVRDTGRPGNHHNQTIYVLKCRRCGAEYGANGADIWLRRCPKHDGGAPGLPF